MRDENDVSLIDVKNYKSYALLKGQDYGFSFDWTDGKYYDWAVSYLYVYGKDRAHTNVVIVKTNDGDYEMQRFTFNKDFEVTLEYMALEE